jgi:hypothetical protein
MVRPRRGAGKLGCLFTLLIIAATAYFAVPVGEAYFRFYRYEDEMRQAARFARVNSDAVIQRRLQAVADSLGLPPEAKSIAIRRNDNRIFIGAQYVEEFELPGTVRLHTFVPEVEGTY